MTDPGHDLVLRLPVNPYVPTSTVLRDVTANVGLSRFNATPLAFADYDGDSLIDILAASLDGNGNQQLAAWLWVSQPPRRRRTAHAFAHLPPTAPASLRRTAHASLATARPARAQRPDVLRFEERSTWPMPGLLGLIPGDYDYNGALDAVVFEAILCSNLIEYDGNQ